ncbi:choice-of-anchor A family protein [Catellatospora vulcania]|uniref:choice-of-anchor A family protein n=1 Tax=Catellatospora vulcania TaxID=1460450 RepID=UPI0018AF79DB|nr:choice-of-anchor A family protein [Catellatospora vulcania]
MITADPAHAVSPSAPTAAALGFNVFVAGNATLTSNESEGPVALGGALTIGGNYQVGGNSSGTFIAPGDSVPSALVIGGTINFPGSTASILSVQNNAYAKLGNPAGADVRDIDDSNNPGPTHIVAENAAYNSMPRVQLGVTQPVVSVLAATGINFATAFADFRSSSSDLATCVNNVILRDANGGLLPPNLPPGTNAFITLAPGTNVLNLTAANLTNISTLTFLNQPSAAAPLLINVDTGPGNVFNWTVPNQAGISGANAPYLLWNFPTATAITLATNGATLEGTLYAPNAALTDLSSSNIEGQVIAASLIHGTAAANGGEMHHFPFAATLSCVATPTPDLSTDASGNITLGGQIHDVATLAGGENPTGTITFTLYGPNDATCTGTAVDTSVATVVGDGEYMSDDFTPTQAGVYRWIASYSGDDDNAGVTQPCNAANESVVVGPAVVTPTLTTDASDDITLGGQVSDTATLAGGQNPTGTITFSLYGPNNATCTGTPVFTTAVPVSNNGIYPSLPFPPTQPGTYRWIASYSGDAANAGVTLLCNAPNESVVVRPAVVTPTLTTDASDNITLGGQINDTATLAGGQNPTGTITFSLYGPNNATCTGDPVFTSTVPVSGNSTYLSQAFAPTLAGTYRWIASYSGDAANAGVTRPCNDPNESVVVSAGTVTPTLSTDASDDITLGGQIRDTATLAGGQSPTGTITFSLYGPDNATCTGTPVFTSTVPVTGNGNYPSQQFTPTLAGTYRWIASYSGDAVNAGVTRPCNDPNESVVVSQGTVTPTLTTDASRDTYVGKEIYDRATLAGGIAPTGTITFRLYGPGDATCSRTPVFTSTVDVSGNGDYRSDPFRAREPGTYQWVASYSGDDGNQAVQTSCGDPAERVVIKKKRPYGGKPRP